VWVAGFYGKPRPLGRAARTRPFFGSLFGFPAVYAHPREVWGVGLRGQQATLSPLVQVDDPEWAHSLDLRLAARSIALSAATIAARCSSTGGSSEETTWDRPGEREAAHDYAPHEPDLELVEQLLRVRPLSSRGGPRDVALSASPLRN
jgi:hypothetical protein